MLRAVKRLPFITLLLTAAALAQTTRDRAREELEKELQQMVNIPAPKLVLVFESLGEPNYKLDEAEFVLDGKKLSTPGTAKLNEFGDHVIYSGEVSHGEHSLVSRVVYTDASDAM